ncbi:MAG: APC family permease [Chthoniobacterales bacterium]
MESKSKFKRVLGKWDIFTLAFGAMIGWGWVVLTSEWILQAGVMGAILAVFIGGVVVSLIGFIYAELTSAMPKVGGEHVFSFRGLGVNASFICTWFIILGYVSICAFEAVALPVVLENIMPFSHEILLWEVNGGAVHLYAVLIGVAGSLAIGFMNYIGVKSAAFIQSILTAFILLVGGMLVFGSFFVSNSPVDSKEVWDTGKLSIGLMSVLIMTPFMFVGFDVIPQAAEETNLPFKKIGRVLVLSVTLAVVWYIAIIYSVGITIPASGLKSMSLAPGDAMQVIFGGKWAKGLLLLAGLAGILTSWNSFFIGATRSIYAMGQSGMLPMFFARLHPKYKSPVNAILFVTATSILATLFGEVALRWIVNAGSLGIVISWSIVSIAFISIRKKEPGMNRPFRVPFGKWVGILAFVFSLGLVYLYLPGSPSALSGYEWTIILLWSLTGLLFYLWTMKFYGKKKISERMYEHIHD